MAENQEHISVSIHTEFIKLDSLLKFAGLCDSKGAQPTETVKSLFKKNGILA